MKKYVTKLGVAAGLSLTLLATGCGSDTTSGGDGSVGDQLNYTITGIDAGAGIMAATEEAIEAYGLEDYTLQTSSSAAMTAALAAAYENEEPIVVTGWTPHWKFAKYDLKYLEDPQGIFGESEVIHTIARLGLDEDHPSAFEVLDNFYWEQADMGEIMIAVNEGADPEDAASEWVANNQEKVSEWTNGVAPVDGDKLTLALVAWDSEIASTHMIGKVLEDIGYDVELLSLEAAGMWTAVATGSADAIVAAWLPGTHAAYYEDYKEDFIDLGVNLEGAGIGLVVPTYMDIDSIEDLNN
ncbi:glycine/betaine ABC transporter [Anaerobacillus alkalidiazotrophicus]|uniref:Glycine/betaine ABC transporter n=1 Tax=Anaerobacillus alkalidiazotrophicus TaxID=472963 RepID=A0A1S2MD02_9BACI|nr:glycine betaine ABC transporter substrate-binding protein [Anaerobacillus alkalidiazotrophicus]OIJ21555.1 glycine/betaine ABC transporter [Anaerobacillus alkalidiazotrophicus]